MAAVLDAGRGAALSHAAAAALWKIPGFEPGAVEVSRPRGGTRRRSSLALVHEPGLLPPHHVTQTQGVPVTVVARTLFDLAGALRPGRLERALDNCLARGLTTPGALQAITSELAQHGRSGSALMRALLAVRGPNYVAPASGLESRFLWLLRREGIREPVRQVDVGADAWVGRVDFAYPDRKVVIEVDSDLHHTSRLDRQADSRRDAALQAAGFQVVRVTAEQVWHRPDEAIGVVRTALHCAAA
ncbi:MAG: endonuclease domain-containing protein [Actinomycetota bacterium]|nr:endonuclease domain-containing protein [Actinomycetota bacterium]